MQNLSGEALNSAGQDELAAGAQPNPAPSQRTDLAAIRAADYASLQRRNRRAVYRSISRT